MSDPTLFEQRAALQRQIDEIDLSRVDAILEILSRKAVQQAVADLRLMVDVTDTTAGHRSASADTNALLFNALAPFENVPSIAEAMRANLEAKLNPPAEPAVITRADPPTE